MLHTVVFILQAFVGFSLLILVHELGHFLAAKWVGVRVEAFSLGFGPCLKKKWGDTEYRLSAIPLGGYVKLAGEEPKEDERPAPDEFYAKSVGQRSIVFAAGVVMNMIFGLVIFIVAYGVGVPVLPAVVGDVEPGSPAWKIGLKRGDRIERIDDLSPPVDFEDLRITVTLSRAGRGIRLGIRRNGETIEKTLEPEFDEERGIRSAGIYPYVPAVVGERPVSDSGEPLPDEPDLDAVFRAGLAPGDVITAVEVPGRAEPIPIETPDDFMDAMQECGDEQIRIFYSRDGTTRQPVTIRPRAVGKPVWLGVRFGSNVVKAVRRDSWAHRAGFRAGDAVVSVDGKPTPSQYQVLEALDSGRRVDLEAMVQRNGAALTLHVAARGPQEEAAASLAFEPGLVAAHCWPSYPLARAGMRPGDRIVSADAVAVSGGRELHGIVVKAKGRPIELAWLRHGATHSRRITPQRLYRVDIPWQRGQKTVRAGFLDSCRLGTRKAVQWIFRIYGTLRSLATGTVSTKHLSGPIGIGYLTFAAARSGTGKLLYILGVLSVNLGIVNLLPIPVFDGGHLLFAVIEKMRGKAVSERIRAAASYVGLAVILSIVMLTFWNDIRMFIFG